MIERYSLPKMRAIWSEVNKFQSWLDVEIAVAEGHAKFGDVPREAVDALHRNVKPLTEQIVGRIEEIEAELHHDLMAFVKAVTEQLGDEGKYVHYGVTSYDIEDTATAIRLRDSADLLIADVERLMEAVRTRAREHRDTLMIGRTHGIHAEPITFGFKMAVWLSQLERDLERLRQAKDVISYGKISGAVGTYANVDPRIEQYVCEKLGLKPAPVSTQIIQRDRHAQFLTTLSILASSIENFATEVRNLQRTEILEVQEFFTKNQRGSSAMPHKRNPRLSEQMTGLARVVRANAIPAMENIVSWHERDLTNSACERIIIPDSCLATDYMLQTFARLVEKMIVHPENMMRNLQQMDGLVCSEQVMLALIRKGLSREEAYKAVQRNAARAWDEGRQFAETIGQDPEVAGKLSEEDLTHCLDYSYHLKNLERIYERLGI